MIRPFAGVQAIGTTGTAQPVFGTTVSTAFTPPPDPFSNNLNPGSNETQVKVNVASSLGFIVGDYVLVGAAADFKPGLATVMADSGTVKQIVDATHVVVQGLKNTHAAGEFFVLAQDCGFVRIRPIVNTALLYIGNASTVTATDPSLLDELSITTAGTAPAYVFDAPSIGGSQPYNTHEFWIEGTALDTFLARFTTV